MAQSSAPDKSAGAASCRWASQNSCGGR